MSLIVAHRGAMTEAPENTKSAFDKALSYPIDGIEFDVQITRDCIPVIFHDAHIHKKSNGTGKIPDYTYAQLCDWDWGGWFSPRYQGEKILTLQNMLEYYGNQTRLFIEIKSSPDPKNRPLYAKLPELTVSYIRQYIPSSRKDQIYILSFDQDLLSSTYDHDPGLQYVLNLDFPVSDADSLKMEFNKISGLCLSYRKITSDFISWFHLHDKKVMTYSCNIPQSIKKAVELKIDVIMTDAPHAVIDSFIAIKKRILTKPR